jgi:GT2 family glycosyltransferase
MHVDVLFISNDDVTLAPDVLDVMVPALWDDGRYDLLSGANHDAENNGIMENVFTDFSFYGIRPAEFVEKFGTFDENFYPAYFEDNDMHYRMTLLDGSWGIHEGARIYHEGSVTQFWDGEENRVVSHDAFRANRAYYENKWGGQPTEEKYTLPFDGHMGWGVNEWLTVRTD